VTDVAGEVVAVGPGVGDLAAGDQVVAMLNSLVRELHSWQHLSMFVIFTQEDGVILLFEYTH
jgi:NADPH:quinone reductase-like Zn-dependent oxidoreductase